MQALFEIVLPVFLLIALGAVLHRRRMVDADTVARLTPIVFVVLMGPLLFRTMARAGLGQVSAGPTAAYYASSLMLFAAVALLQAGLRGVPRAQAVVQALAATFSNTAMIGIPIVGLAFGDAGLRILLPIIALHALVILTLATVVLELDAARSPGAQAGAWTAARRAIRQSLLHPVVLPIVAGLAWHRAGLALPGPADRALQMLGDAGPTMSLLMLGASLGHAGLRRTWRGALGLAALKSLLHPALVLAVGSALGLSGLPLAVTAVTGALPIGGNVYLFAQRYGVEVGRVSAAVALSTLLSIVSLAALLSWFR